MLKKYEKYSYTILYKILPQKLDVVKCYFDIYLAKEFI